MIKPRGLIPLDIPGLSQTLGQNLEGLDHLRKAGNWEKSLKTGREGDG